MTEGAGQETGQETEEQTGRSDVTRDEERDGLAALVDDLEGGVEREREERDVPGNASDREDQEPMTTEDQAPE
jgi:hypothetical protein